LGVGIKAPNAECNLRSVLLDLKGGVRLSTLKTYCGDYFVKASHVINQFCFHTWFSLYLG